MQYRMHLPADLARWLEKWEALKGRPVKDMKKVKNEADALFEELSQNIHDWMDKSYTSGLTQGTRIVEDFVAEHKKAKEEAAHKDEQTGLFNKRYFEKEGVPNFVRNVVFDKRDPNDQLYDLAALWFLDVNNLKITNDTLGHKMGDALILRLASLLSEHVRDHKEGTLSGRLGGDEFGVLQTRIRLQREVYDSAGRIMHEFSNAPFWNQVDRRFATCCPPQVSVGVAVLRLSSIRGAALSPEEVTEAWLKAADQNMYYCKDQKLIHPCLHAYDFQDGKFVKCDLGDSRTIRMTQETS